MFAFVCVCVCELVPLIPVPPEFSHDQPKQVQVQEDGEATLPLLGSANPDDVSCSWLYRKELLQGEALQPSPRRLYKRLAVELSQHTRRASPASRP